MTTETLRAASTIVEQLGGGRFVAMTGAKGFVALEETPERRAGVSFRIGRNAKAINWVRVSLTYADTYTVEFGRGYKKARVVGTATDVYADMLGPVFESATGMYTHL